MISSGLYFFSPLLLAGIVYHSVFHLQINNRDSLKQTCSQLFVLTIKLFNFFFLINCFVLCVCFFFCCRRQPKKNTAVSLIYILLDRTTTIPRWNRYSAVDDIDHMVALQYHCRDSPIYQAFPHSFSLDYRESHLTGCLIKSCIDKGRLRR